ncbi:MAG: carboxypeptidase-like regulatory domain-containing protein, partial [Candidatus Micrarchaeota archaeon]|nr:carboxypeptidase-like regulatory domain-containing protein [Candidatus Micrarchaeota archaeon]
ARVLFLLDGGTSQVAITDSFGEAEVQLSGTSHISIEVTKDGYQSAQKSVPGASPSGSVPVTLQKLSNQKPEQRTATVVVDVSDTNGNSVTGVLVKLVDANTQSPFASAYADAFGQATFDGVDTGKTFSISASDEEARYAAYASTRTYQAADSPLSIRLPSTTQSAPTFAITVRDEAGDGVSGADVTLYAKTSKNHVASLTTDAFGNARLAVDEADLYVTVFKDGHLPATLFAKNTGEAKATLKAETEANAVSVEVNVKKTGEPIAYAGVQLFDRQGYPIGVADDVTGADGTVTFRVPRSSQPIYAVASSGVQTGQSDQAIPQSALLLAVELQAPKASLLVKVTDAATQKPVSSASVHLLDNGEKASCQTINGECRMDVPTDIEFKIVVDAADYLPYQSAPVFVAAGTNADAQAIVLYPRSLATAATIAFQGFFDENGRSLREAANVQNVQARLAVTVPASSPTDQTRLTLWMDAGQNGSSAAITSASGPLKTYSGADAPLACTPEAAEQAPGQGQWVVFDFPPGFSGTQQIALNLLTNADATPGSQVTIRYRLHGWRNNTPYAYPLDSALLQELIGKQAEHADFCSAQSVRQTLSISRDALYCQDGFCSRTVFTLANGAKSRAPEFKLGESFTAAIDVVGLDAGIRQLTVAVPESLDILSLSRIEAGGANGSTFASEASASADAQALQKASFKLEGRAVRATSNAKIALTAQDANGLEQAFSASARVTGNNRFSVTVTPQELEAFESRNVRVIVKDRLSNPVTDAVVTLYECEDSPLNGEEPQSADNQQGAYVFKINPVSVG